MKFKIVFFCFVFSGKSLDVVMCDWWNPRDFYIQIRKKEPEFKRFTNQLNRFYEIDVKDDEDYVVHALPGIQEGLIVAALFWSTKNKNKFDKCLGMRFFKTFFKNSSSFMLGKSFGRSIEYNLVKGYEIFL